MNPHSSASAPTEHTLKITPAHLGMRVDQVLAQLLPDTSRSKLQLWCAAGAVTQAGVALEANNKIKKVLPIIAIAQPDASLDAFAPEDIALDRVYEDEYLIVINKPVGLVVHPGANNWTGTLMNGLLFHYPDSAALPRAGIVHRLDRDTSGLMVVAKTSAAYNALVAALKARTVQRRYLAMVHGVPIWTSTQVDAPIGRDPKLRTRMAVVLGTVARPSTGKQAITDARVIASHSGLGVSLLECKLHTGRTHQIRVHMAYKGHALLGDATYGGKPLLEMTRQALHAWKLSFTHPITGAEIANQITPPADLLAAMGTMQVQWPALANALAQSPDFTVDTPDPTALAEDIFDFGMDEDDFDEDEDFDDGAVEVIYVRD